MLQQQQRKSPWIDPQVNPRAASQEGVQAVRDVNNIADKYSVNRK